MKFLGKESSIEDSLRRFEGELSRRGIEVELSHPLLAVDNLWSIHLRSKNFPQIFTNGKGVTKESAVASALGEFFERLSMQYFFSSYYVGQHPDGFCFYPNEVAIEPRKLDPLWIKFYLDGDREDQAFYDLGSGRDKIICLPFVDFFTGKQRLVPINLLTNLFGSNGMAAGNTRQEALVQAMSEIIERYVKYRIIAERISLPQIPLTILAQYPVAMQSIRALEANGYTILVNDASLGGAYPVVNVTLVDPKTLSTFASFGAHPKFQVALERTLTELCQGRKVEDLSKFPKPSWSEELVADPNNLEAHFIDSNGLLHWDFLLNPSEYSYQFWDCPGSINDELTYLASILEQEEKDVLIFETDHLGIPTVRVIVIGMSEVYPIEDMLINNCNKGIFLQQSLMNLHHLEFDELVQLLSQLEEFEADPLSLIAPMIGLYPDAQTGWDTLSIIHLRALLCLATADAPRLRECLELWQMAGSVPQVFDLALILLAQAEAEEEDDSEQEIPNREFLFPHLFSLDIFNEAQALLESPFCQLPELGDEFSNCQNQQKIIELLRLSQQSLIE